ncbi:MAG: GNAT family N-acetyltransferase [Rhodococcus sp. (in: high G+C Gram-positive bacteria)]
MTTDDTITIRRATEDDWDAIALLDAHAFGEHQNSDDMAETKLLTASSEIFLACDGDLPVGVTMHFPMDVTVPGGTSLPATGVSWVSVAPTHRRRGILRRLFTAQHERFEDAGKPLSVLTASEATIYERFGYGAATQGVNFTIDRRFTAFRKELPPPEGARLMTSEQARELLPDIHDRWRRVTPGAQPMPTTRWQRFFADRKNARGGFSKLFFIVHPDGYVAFRRGYRVGTAGAQEARVDSFVAVTDEARSALWQVLCGVDLVESIEVTLPAGDPLLTLLTDRRVPAVTGVKDGLWVRLMDVPAALTARTYAIDTDLTIAVEDPFLNAGGVFRFVTRDGRAEVTPTTGEPDVTLSSSVLGSMYLGAHRARQFAAAGRVTTTSEKALHEFDLVFSTPSQPQIGWFF